MECNHFITYSSQNKKVVIKYIQKSTRQIRSQSSKLVVHQFFKLCEEKVICVFKTGTKFKNKAFSETSSDEEISKILSGYCVRPTQNLTEADRKWIIPLKKSMLIFLLQELFENYLFLENVLRNIYFWRTY